MTDAHETARRGIASKRVALWGLALPYIVDLALLLGVQSIAGHSGYTASPEELGFYGRIATSATWIALGLSAPLSLPYAAGFIRQRAQVHADRAGRMASAGAWAIAYAGLLVGNGLMVLFAHMVARTAAQGMR